jgi:chemotaxis family two-component system sensor kinase Cph1
VEAARHPRGNAGVNGCDSEPIHVPGSVQAHGGLLAFNPDDGQVVYRSENLASLLDPGIEPLGATLGDVLGADGLVALLAAPDGSTTDLIPVRLELNSGRRMDVAAHRSDGLVVVEFERPSETERHSVLLYEVRRAVERIEAARDMEEACSAVVEEVRRLTGYDRVMVYHFHEDDHGEVVAEARRPTAEPYLGLHYPATDIPRPARRLLRLSPTRLIADVEGPPVPIVGHGAFAAQPLDLSRSALRAVSPIHLQYLRNMGVGASLTISLADGPRLWGLVACHHGQAKLPSAELRSACAIVTRAFWLKFDAQQELDRHVEQQGRLSLRAHFLATVSGVPSIAEAFVEDGHSLLDLVGADGVAVRIDDVSANLGATASREVTTALVESLRESQTTFPVVTDHAAAAFPGLGLEAATAAGVLALPVTPDWGEYVIWFRGEAERTRTWAGDPAKPVQGAAGDPTSLTPRSSFAAWQETTRGHSAPWTRSDRSAAAEFAASLPAVRAARGRDAFAKLALRDGLTGLPNRALLLDRLEVALAELRRETAASGSCSSISTASRT